MGNSHATNRRLGGRARIFPAVPWAYSLELPSSEKFVLVSLVLHASDAGDNCYPGIDLLAMMTGLSRRQVQRNIKRLVERGAIRRELGGGRNRTNRYYLNLGWDQNRDTSDTLREATTDQKGDMPTGNGDMEARKGDMDGRETVTWVSPKVQRRNKEDSYTVERAPSRVSTDAAPHPPDPPSDPIRRREIFLTFPLLTVKEREGLKAKIAELKAENSAIDTGPSDA